MDLKTLLNEAHWDSSNLSYDNSTLKEDIKMKTKKPIRRVLDNAKRAIVLNSIFVIAFLAVYFIVPNQVTLIAVAIITGCYLLTIGSMVYGLFTLKEPNLNQEIRPALEDILRYDEAINAFQCKYFSWIITGAYAGGFLLGIGIQGKSMSQLLDKWPLLIIWVAGAVGVYFYSKTKGFRSFNRSLNPNYFKSKNIIKEQLQLLNSES